MDKGLTQRQLKDLTGIHRNRIQAFERDERQPSSEEVHKLMEMLGWPSSLIA